MECKEKQPFAFCLHRATQLPEQLVTRGSCQIYWHFFLSKRLENSNRDITASSCQSFYFPRKLNQTLEWLLLFIVSFFRNYIDSAALWDSSPLQNWGKLEGNSNILSTLLGKVSSQQSQIRVMTTTIHTTVSQFFNKWSVHFQKLRWRWNCLSL